MPAILQKSNMNQAKMTTLNHLNDNFFSYTSFIHYSIWQQNANKKKT